MVKANVENSSINNKSIHEIWSPDPSPNGLSSVSPTEEINPYVPNQQQQQQQPAQNEGSPEESFEQTSVNEMENTEQQGQDSSGQPQQSNEHQQQQQPYSTTVYEEVDGSQNPATSPTQMYYPPLPMMHQQYMYRGMGPPQPHHRVPPEMYPMHHPAARGNMMPQRPVIYGPGYYQPQAHYNKYSQQQQQPPPQQPHHPSQDARYRPRGHHHHNHNNHHHHNHNNRHYPNYHHPSYETKMGFLEELGIALDECRDQLRHLERDYKKVFSDKPFLFLYSRILGPSVRAENWSDLTNDRVIRSLLKK